MKEFTVKNMMLLLKKFVRTTEKLFPEILLHWEDFGRSNAAKILDKYQDQLTTFNDDIQGTGLVVMAGIFGALNISKEDLKDQVILNFGAGTAGVGICNLIFEEMVRSGLSEEEARKHFYLVDKQGLLFSDTEDLTPGQKAFVRERSEFETRSRVQSRSHCESCTPNDFNWYFNTTRNIY